MFIRTCLLIGGVFSLSGCVAGVVAGAGAVGVAAVQDRTIGEGFDDASASSQVKTRLMTAGPKRFNEVDVEIANKLALLTGRVTSPEDKLEAERIAWSVALVDKVANEIQIEEPGGVRKNLNDEWITARVRSSLFTNGAVKSVNINVETYNGVVYLMGIARSDEELRKAAEAASLVGGVQEVVSYIEVRDPNASRNAGGQMTASNG